MTRKVLCLFALVAAMGMLPMNSSAQSIVNINATVPSFLGITVPVGSTVTFNFPGASQLSDLIATGTPDVQINTTYLVLGAGTVNVCAEFATPAQALTDGTFFIPSDNVSGTVNGVGPTPLNTVTSCGGVGLDILSTITPPFFGFQTDTLQLDLDLTNIDTLGVPAGAYTGTLTILGVVV